MPAQSQSKRRHTTQTAGKPVKRTRVSRACDQCRTAREKCDGLQPMCSTCSTQNRRCAYTASPKKRGIQPGYIRSLELALAWLFQHNPENETLLNENLSKDGTTSILLSRDSKESNKLHKRWRRTRFYSDVDKLLSGGEPSRYGQTESLSPQGNEEDEASGGDEPLSDTPHQSQHPTTIPEAKQMTTAAICPSTIKSPSSPVTGSLLLSMPIDSWALLETYFTYFQSWLPICEKYDLLKLSYSYPKEGLFLSPVHRDSGSHAELWSVLAVASLHHTSSAVDDSTSCEKLYNTTKGLIPDELGRFDLGHVKALLNLALFNVIQAHEEAARLLVGLASRILEQVDQLSCEISLRRKHVFAGCFLVDNFLSILLRRRPYFLKNEIKNLGSIEEDGLEEWQPWSGHATSSEHTRMPMLALSFFNNLLNLLDILVGATLPLPQAPPQDSLGRLVDWESSLPQKLKHIQSNFPSSHLTPPSALLRLTYHCTCFILRRTEPDLKRFYEVLEHSQNQIGSSRTPPMIRGLLDLINRQTEIFTRDHRTQIQKSGVSIEAWSLRKHSERIGQTITQRNLPVITPQIPTPELLQIILPTVQELDQPVTGYDTNLEAEATGILSSDTPVVTSLLPQSTPGLDPRYPDAALDLDSFFDEIASLDRGARMESQPQFLQNLGFAPDANMADLFSEYMPIQSTEFLPSEDIAPIPFDQYNFYDT
ncbi:hypothetical protein ACN47E_005703 [Coniothyrium glycines]